MIAIPSENDQLAQLDAETLAAEGAMREAVNDAVIAHKRLGLPMVEWHDGQVVWVPAEALVVDEPSGTPFHGNA